MKKCTSVLAKCHCYKSERQLGLSLAQNNLLLGPTRISLSPFKIEGRRIMLQESIYNKARMKKNNCSSRQDRKWWAAQVIQSYKIVLSQTQNLECLSESKAVPNRSLFIIMLKVCKSCNFIVVIDKTLWLCRSFLAVR